MISIKRVMRQVLTETMSFRDILRQSEQGRISRGEHDVNARSMRVTTMDGDEAWTFNYKSNPSTTGQRWHGYIKFLKGQDPEQTTAEDLDCMIDCDCPDFRYRYAYNDAQAGVGTIGRHPDWKYGNQNNGQKWKPVEQGGVGDHGVGLCKHLISLGSFLKTKLDPVAPEPDDAPVDAKHTSHSTSDIEAPEPDDSYSDSRSGTLQESYTKSSIEKFVKETPEFDVQVNEQAIINERLQTGEWWIDETGQTTFADIDVGDSGHEGVVINYLIYEILSSFGVNVAEPSLLSEHEDDIKEELIQDDNFSTEDGEQWEDGPSEVILRKLLEMHAYTDAKQAEDAVYIAYGSSNRDARDYGMHYLGWKIMKVYNGSIEIQTWTLTTSDLTSIVRGIWDILDDEGTDDSEVGDNGFSGPRVNVTIQSTGKIFLNIPLAVLEKKMPAALGDYRRDKAWMTENINESYHHHHKDYRLYEGHSKIVALFNDNSRLFFEVHFRDKRGEDKEKWRHKALSTWRSVANEIHRDVQLTDACNPIQKTWKQSFEEALKSPRLQPYMRASKHRRISFSK